MFAAATTTAWTTTSTALSMTKRVAARRMWSKAGREIAEEGGEGLRRAALPAFGQLDRRRRACFSTTSSELNAKRSRASNDAAGGIGNAGSEADSKLRGRALLLMVALLYGTLNVALRAVYASEGPPIASALSFVRQCLSVLCFLPLLGTAGHDNGGNDGFRRNEPPARPMWTVALELAFWNFGAQGLINAGLLYTSAARASFLTQTSVIITPVLSASIGKERIRQNVWTSCLLSLLGLLLISSSSSTIPNISSMSNLLAGMSPGDWMILGGALSWSTYIFRTSQIANAYSELHLQGTKNALLAILYGGWLGVTLANFSLTPHSPSSFFSDLSAAVWPGWDQPYVWILLLYTAIGPGMLADILQQRGQNMVSSPTQSNVLLCMEPVFALFCSFLFLGEFSNGIEILGGSLIVLAAILASL